MGVPVFYTNPVYDWIKKQSHSSNDRFIGHLALNVDSKCLATVYKTLALLSKHLINNHRDINYTMDHKLRDIWQPCVEINNNISKPTSS